MKKCPFCAEEIQDEAVICKHCGKSTDKKDEIHEEIINYTSFSKAPNIRCKRCRYEGKGQLMKEKGNTLITIILLICYIIPGIIYSIWRGPSFYGCPKCKSKLVQRIKK